MKKLFFMPSSGFLLPASEDTRPEAAALALAW
jgi:hypothetical protein